MNKFSIIITSDIIYILSTMRLCLLYMQFRYDQLI